MRKVAVILCSKTKKDYACQAVEMYQDSWAFKARQLFMDVAYDEWYINTSKYGFMKPEMEIEPYDCWYLGNGTPQLKVNNKLTPEMVNEWLELLKTQFPNREDIELHCHISKIYYDKLKTIFPNIVYYKSQTTFYITAFKYLDATNMLLNGVPLNECLDFINTKSPNTRPKEQPKWYYHMDGREYYGTSSPLGVLHKVNDANAHSLTSGVIPMTLGWVIDKDLLPHIKKYPSGRYGLSKEARKNFQPKIYGRRGLREEIDRLTKLNKRYKEK
jgi:hypothetical protein